MSKKELKEVGAEPKGFNFNKAFMTDKKKELEGLWTDISMGGEQMEIMLARRNNKNAMNYQRALLRKHEVVLKPNDDKANELFMKITYMVIARCVILDWKGVIIDGDIIPYSEEVCVQLLEFQDFYNLIEEVSGGMEIFRADKNAKILGN